MFYPPGCVFLFHQWWFLILSFFVRVFRFFRARTTQQKSRRLWFLPSVSQNNVYRRKLFFVVSPFAIVGLLAYSEWSDSCCFAYQVIGDRFWNRTRRSWPSASRNNVYRRKLLFVVSSFAVVALLAYSKWSDSCCFAYQVIWDRFWSRTRRWPGAGRTAWCWSFMASCLLCEAESSSPAGSCTWNHAVF